MDLEIEKIRDAYRESKGSGGFVNPANLNHYTDWLEQQLKNCNLQSVSNNEVAVCDNCGCHPTVIYLTTSGRFCEKCKP